MKGLTKSAVLISLMPLSALAEFQPLNEGEMGSVTGQSGVTIELQTRVSMDEFRYTDEGSLSISDVSIGGANRTDFFSEMNIDLAGSTPSNLLDNFRMDIDVLSDGDAVINLLPTDSLRAVDLSVQTGSWNLVGQTDSTTVLDNFRMDALIGAGTLRVHTSTDKLNVDTALAVDDMDFDVPFLALGIRDVEIVGHEYDLDAPQPLDLFADLELDLYKANNAAGAESLAIDLHQFQSDVRVGGVIVGGTSIGSIAMDNLSITNTSMRVYGH